MPIIHGLYESDHNPHEQQLLALHQVRSNERPMSHRAPHLKNTGTFSSVPREASFRCEEPPDVCHSIQYQNVRSVCKRTTRLTC